MTTPTYDDLNKTERELLKFRLDQAEKERDQLRAEKESMRQVLEVAMRRDVELTARVVELELRYEPKPKPKPKPLEQCPAKGCTNTIDPRWWAHGPNEGNPVRICDGHTTCSTANYGQPCVCPEMKDQP